VIGKYELVPAGDAQTQESATAERWVNRVRLN